MTTCAMRYLYISGMQVKKPVRQHRCLFVRKRRNPTSKSKWRKNISVALLSMAVLRRVKKNSSQRGPLLARLKSLSKRFCTKQLKLQFTTTN